MKTLIRNIIDKLTKPSANKQRNILIVLIVLLSLITLVVIMAQISNNKNELAKIASLKTSEAPTERVMLVQLSINSNNLADKPFGLTDVNAYNGHMDNTYLSANGGTYKLNLTNGQKSYEIYFQIETVESETIDPATGNYIKLESALEEAKTLKVPYFPKGAQIKITDPSGRIVLEETINNIKENNNQSKYNTVAGEDVEN